MLAERATFLLNAVRLFESKDSAAALLVAQTEGKLVEVAKAAIERTPREHTPMVGYYHTARPDGPRRPAAVRAPGAIRLPLPPRAGHVTPNVSPRRRPPTFAMRRPEGDFWQYEGEARPNYERLFEALAEGVGHVV